MPALSGDGDAFVLDLGADENRFAPARLTPRCVRNPEQPRAAEF